MTFWHVSTKYLPGQRAMSACTFTVQQTLTYLLEQFERSRKTELDQVRTNHSAAAFQGLIRIEQDLPAIGPLPCPAPAMDPGPHLLCHLWWVFWISAWYLKT